MKRINEISSMSKEISWDELQKLVVYYQRSAILCVPAKAFENNKGDQRFSQGSVSNYENGSLKVPAKYVEFLFEGDWEAYQAIESMLVREFDLVQVPYRTGNVSEIKQMIIERFNIPQKIHEAKTELEALTKKVNKSSKVEQHVSFLEKRVSRLYSMARVHLETMRDIVQIQEDLVRQYEELMGD